MKVIRSSEVAGQEALDPIFVGSVTRQPLIDAGESGHFTAGIVTFSPGARTRLHRHSHDQLLVIIYGNGILATEQERNEVHQGDLILIPAEERHWHGGTATSVLSHISILAPETKTELLE